MPFDFTNSPTVGQQITAPTGAVYIWDGTAWRPANATLLLTYANLPPAVQQAPVAFPFSGKPLAAARVNVPIAMAVTIPANLTGTQAFASTATTAAATFTINKVSGGTVTALGTVVVNPTGAPTLTGAGGSLAVGDTLQCLAPATQDSTLADVGVTIMCRRT